jgi:hypothetical protein
MTIGPDLRRSVHQGRLEASTVFRPVLESSKLPPTIPLALHGNGVDGLASSLAPAYDA